MALCACGRAQGLCVAGPAAAAAVIDAAAAFIGNTRVWTFVNRRPIAGRVAGGALQAEHAGMEGRIGMAACTGRGQTGKLAGGMTALALDACMCAG